METVVAEVEVDGEPHLVKFSRYASRELEGRMFDLLMEQLETKRLVPSAGEAPGYRPPAVRSFGHE
jgi:hypothetical protein